MARILITSGPTRQYLDPVRYITNASSGRMGASLAAAALELKHEVVVISGPVAVDYPQGAEIISVVTTDEMLRRRSRRFATVTARLVQRHLVITCHESCKRRRFRRQGIR